MRLALACLIGFAAAVSADDKPLTISIAGGQRDLTDVVVRVALPDKTDTTEVRLEDSAGAHLLGQVAPPRLLAAGGAAELTFVLPSLKAGETKAFTVLTTFAQTRVPARFEWRDAPGDHADLLFDRRPALRYVYSPLDESSKERGEQTFKVYHHLYDATGQTLVTKGPGGLYTHHRGLFFGFNKVTYGENRKADVWHCTGDAYQSHEGFLQQAAGVLFGRHRVKIAWHGEKKQVFAEEERELTVFRPQASGVLVEFATILKTTGGQVRLDGDPQHSGFHLRVSNEVADQFNQKMPQTYFLRPDGKGPVGEERNWDPKTKKGPINLPWDAMSFVLGQKRYTALYLDHPENPKEARGSERIYGRVGNYFEYDLSEDKPLRLRYRVWLQAGEMTIEQCEALSRAFVEPVAVELK